jgi:endonuclease YncB( thermonuclease family)
MQKYKGKILRVIDGDTIEAAIFLGFNISIKKKIRIIGINAPETRSRDEKTKQAAFAAKKRLEELFPTKDLVIESKGFDKYGRCLAVVHSDAGDVGQILLNEGLVEKMEFSR